MTLPSQQIRCLYYLSRGMTYKEIDRAMDLSPRTIEYYIKLIREKTGIQTRCGLVQFFYGVSNEAMPSPLGSL